LEGSEVFRRLLMWAFAASLAAWIPSAALAQILTPDRVQLELARTDERIHQAELLLAGNTNVQAAAEIETAKARQDQARAALAAARPRMALDLTLDARLHADRAVVYLRGADPTRVQEQIDRAREYIDRARERLNECPIDRARSQLHVAEAMLDRAQEALTAGRPLAALQLARGAREHARRALQSCRMDDQVQDNVERALHRTDEIVLRAREAIAAHETDVARRPLGRAEELQDAAWRQFRAEHPEAATRLTQLARTFAQRAMRLADGSR
jgi:hypothetical protein